MLRTLHITLAVFMLMLVATAPAIAVIGGQPDGDGHPYGALILAPGIGACSGALIDEDVVLTAGHCSYLNDLYATEVWVTFDPAPAIDANWLPIPGVGTWYVTRTWAAHPDFNYDAWPYTYDYGVVLLDTPVVGIEPARLPTVGLLDELLGTTGQTDYHFNIVGYGTSSYTMGGGPPLPNVDWVRKVSDQRYSPSQSKWNNVDAWFMLIAVPSPQHGSGGPGDSGSSVFPAADGELGDTIVAVHSGGYGMGYYDQLYGRKSNLEMRVDIPLVLDWLAGYLD